jgi:hypothetical protein
MIETLSNMGDLNGARKILGHMRTSLRESDISFCKQEFG